MSEVPLQQRLSYERGSPVTVHLKCLRALAPSSSSSLLSLSLLQLSDAQVYEPYIRASSAVGTSKTVKARFWPGLSGEIP